MKGKKIELKRKLFWKTVYMDFRCTCDILFVLGTITREHENEELLQIK